MKKKLFPSILYTLTILTIGCSPESPENDLQAVKPVSVTSRPEEAFPNQRGALQSGKLNGQTVIYQLFGEQAVFESDILLSEHDLRQSDDLQVEGTGRTKASSRWPNKIVYYSISASLPNQSRVLDAIAHWEATTPIRFVQRTTQRGYVLFQTGSGCSSNVGYVGSVQYVNLASNCTTGNTIHEIGHTVGLWHEHTRADRDTYVDINTGNIITGYETDFQTYVQRGMDGFDSAGGLDFGSVMMYGSYDFSKNGLPTITKKDGSTFTSQRDGLSATDIQTVLTMYP
ncbi:M12 family metallopeptidase [Spirosoma gilvum]